MVVLSTNITTDGRIELFWATSMWTATNTTTTTTSGSTYQSITYAADTTTIAWPDDGSWVFRNTNGTAITYPAQHIYAQPVREYNTPELIAARAAEEKRRLELQELRKAAEQRAEELLKMMLDERQLNEWEQRRRFTVISKDGEREYEVIPRHGDNVRLIKGEPLRRNARVMCIHTDIDLPMGDNLLAQKLLLETDEMKFLETANLRAG